MDDTKTYKPHSTKTDKPHKPFVTTISIKKWKPDLRVITQFEEQMNRMSGPGIALGRPTK